jgi:hypothetical protein
MHGSKKSIQPTAMGEGAVPTVPPSTDGWFYPENQRGLQGLLTPGTLSILEVGSFHGLSARFMLDHAPNASIVCVDTWAGEVLPEVFADLEIFRASCWEYRDRISFVKADSREALPLLLDQGLRPDLVYIDGGHSYDVVEADLINALQFPGALVCGDDYAPEWHEVVTAVNNVAIARGRRLVATGRFFFLGRNPGPPVRRTFWDRLRGLIR